MPYTCATLHGARYLYLDGHKSDNFVAGSRGIDAGASICCNYYRTCHRVFLVVYLDSTYYHHSTLQVCVYVGSRGIDTPVSIGYIHV